VNDIRESPDSSESRLESAAFTSTLSINDFAACASLGLEPVALVQGSTVVVPSTSLYSGGVTLTGQRFAPNGRYYNTTCRTLNDQIRRQMSQGYWQRYRCPHTYDVINVAHATWGANAEQVLLHSAWQRSFRTAFTRMVKQAQKAGAHGIIGVTDSRRPFLESDAIEYRVMGTAVRVADAETSGAEPWTTHLAGQRLVNVIAGGYMPISAIVQRTWMAVWPYCVTEFFLVGKLQQRGLMGEPVQEVAQVSDARMKLIEIATGHVRDEAQSDPVLGIDVEWGDHHLGFGAWVMNVTLRGTRVRRFEQDPIALSSERFLQLK
jgi:uncharacterized protein YbjQ (UPF0145 family)